MATNTQFDNVLSTITTEKVDTLEQLYELQAQHAPSNVFLPYAHNIYDIDLSTRQVHGPEFISARRDHKAEVIYFKVDRYFDYMDLANTICIIEYIVPGDIKRIPHIYIVPFYDTSKFKTENKLIFPWSVGGAATSKEGNLEYAIRFYRIDGEGKNKKLVYNLNTLPTKSKILPSIEGDGKISQIEYDIPVNAYEELIHQVVNNRTYWTIL